jgi:hypothetical protein
MTRVIVFLMMLTYLLPSDGSAQAAPSLGDRARVRQVDGTVLTGTLTAMSPETIRLSIDSASRPAEVPVARIELLETSLGQRRNYSKYMGLTVAASAIAGIIISFAADPCKKGSSFCVGPQSRDELVLLGLAGGAIIGLPVGSVVGTVVREERWKALPLPAPFASGLTIRPVIGRGVGFAISVTCHTPE